MDLRPLINISFAALWHCARPLKQINSSQKFSFALSFAFLPFLCHKINWKKRDCPLFLFRLLLSRRFFMKNCSLYFCLFVVAVVGAPLLLFLGFFTHNFFWFCGPNLELWFVPKANKGQWWWWLRLKAMKIVIIKTIIMTVGSGQWAFNLNKSPRVMGIIIFVFFVAIPRRRLRKGREKLMHIV